MTTFATNALLISCLLLPACKPKSDTQRSETEGMVGMQRGSFTGCVVYTSFDLANGGVGAREFAGAVSFDYSIAISNGNIAGHVVPKNPMERTDSLRSKDFLWTPKPFNFRGKAAVSPDKLDKSATVYNIDNVTLVLNGTTPPTLKQIILVQDGIELKSWDIVGLGGKIQPEKVCD